MPSWEEVRAHLRDRYRLEDDEPEVISMTWSYSDGRSQQLFIRRFRAFDRDMIEIKTPFARQADLDPVTLLRKNSELPLGMVALSGDTYLVVYNAPVEPLPFDEIDFLLRRVAAVGDSLEELYRARDVF